MYGREQTGRPYPQIGVPEGLIIRSHITRAIRTKWINAPVLALSHRAFLQIYLEKLRKTQDGDGSLLDHSILLFGSGISNSDRHTHGPLPTFLVGGGADAESSHSFIQNTRL